MDRPQSYRRVMEERAHGEALADQRELDKSAIEDERAHGRAQLEEERRLAREREQLSEAYRVQVALGAPGGESRGKTSTRARGPAETKVLAS